MISKVVFGTSPFIGAGQFGPKARVYRDRFLQNPQLMADFFSYFIKTFPDGWVNILPCPTMLQAVRIAYETCGKKFPIIGVITDDDMEAALDDFQAVNTKILMIHGALSDTLDIPRLKRIISAVNCRGFRAGASTHNTGHTITSLDTTDLNLEYYLAPLNYTGRHVHPGLDQAVAAVQKTEKYVIGMKILGAGELPPEKAVPFAYQYVKSAAIGFTELREIDEIAALVRES